MGEGTSGARWIGCWMAFRVVLDVGWPSELCSMLDGLQSCAGCWMAFRVVLDALQLICELEM